MPAAIPLKKREEMVTELFERMSKGETLRAICRESHMPNWDTIYDWVNNDEALFRRFARARVLFFDAIAQDCMEIADDGRNDWIEAHDKDGVAIGYKVNGEHIQRSKLRIDTRLKLLGKWDPERYGEKVTIQGDKNKPIAVANVTDQILGMLTLEQLEQVEQLKLGNGGNDDEQGAGDTAADTI